jgi:hypothetical protein
MTYVLVQHKIGKWEEFESIFKDDAARRKRLGSQGGKLFRNTEDRQPRVSRPTRPWNGRPPASGHA